MFKSFRKKKSLGTIYNKHDRIFRQGEAGNSLWYVQSGSVALILKIREHRQLLSVLKKKDIFGIPHLFGEKYRYCTAIAKEDGTAVMKLDKKLMIERMHTDPSFSYNITKMLSERLMGVVRHVPCECSEIGDCNGR
jgi:CRP-like cAMP-binding protein